MADVQKQFELFHETIRVDYGMSEILREKRDIVIKRIKNYLKEHDKPAPTQLLQGSYKMKTGVKPIADIEYDIDIGLRFQMHEDDYSATDVRGWVLEAIGEHTKRVESKGPCIRVCYESGYHLDIVCYAMWEVTEYDIQYRLAHKVNGWRPCDPPGLLDYVNDFREKFKDTLDASTQTDQFRRCVRSLRRWADVLRPTDGNECKPSGIAIVLLCIQYNLEPSSFLDERPDDRTALENLTNTLANKIDRLFAQKPTPEYEDILSGFSIAEMDQLKEEFLDLNEALSFAGASTDPVEACERLQEVFGSDFPVPDSEDTAKKTSGAAILTSSSSA